MRTGDNRIMYPVPDSELEVVALLKQRANVVVANLSWLTSLPTPDYRRALAVLDAAMDHEIPEPVKFIAKLCFSDRRAAAYYRRIFAWWSVASGDTEPLSLEGALCRTFSKAQSQWTSHQLQSIPPHLWPLSIIPRMWRANVPHDPLRHQLLSLLRSGQCNLHMLVEIARIDDPPITAWFLAQPNLPRPVLRALPQPAPIKPKLPYLSSRQLAAAQELFSADLDEDNAIGAIAELSIQVGWPATPPAFDVDAVKPHRHLLLWRDHDHLLTATREDATTLIIRWLIANAIHP